jgi:hydroxymethylpyrimidine/phosphomethylpyrimidine kinase
VHATAARRNDVVITDEVLDEQRFSGSGVFLASAIAHRLTAAGLLKREIDVATESLEQFERCDSDIGKEGVDETWNEQGDFHDVSCGYE